MPVCAWSNRVMRTWAIALGIGVLLVGRLGAASVLFDFDGYPDAVIRGSDDYDAGIFTPLGCSEPPPGTAGCDPVVLQTIEYGTARGYRQTLDGLTLTLTAGGESIDWVDGVVQSGNTDDLYPYVADFSMPLLSTHVEILGAAENGGGAEVPYSIIELYLEAWSGLGATGLLLGRVDLGPDVPAVLAFTAPEGSTIGSLRFAAPTTDHGACHGAICDNLAIIDNLLVTPVPEPGTAALLALGLAVLARYAPAFGSRVRGITARSST